MIQTGARLWRVWWTWLRSWTPRQWVSEEFSCKEDQHGQICSKKQHSRGAWVAQLVEYVTLDFGSGYDPRVVGCSPTVGSTLSMEPTENSLSVSLSLSLSLSVSLSLYLSPNHSFLSLSLSLSIKFKKRKKHSNKNMGIDQVLYKHMHMHTHLHVIVQR